MSIEKRYDFVMLFDVENGNPNGDPDMGNTPRIDIETGHGYITDVCIKRKIRNYVELVKEGEPRFNILVKPDRSLNSKFTEAYKACGLKTGAKDKNADDIKTARDYMCNNYFDVRTFGMVMSTGDSCSCGIVRGPVQINFARSISPVNCLNVTITRQAKTNDKRQETGPTEIGKKSIIPYALYRAEGYISAAQAKKITGFDEADLELLWTAIINMFENDHSAARGKMCMRALYVFEHDSLLGNARSEILFDKIQVEEKAPGTPCRHFSDYTISVDEAMPEGVRLIRKL